MPILLDFQLPLVHIADLFHAACGSIPEISRSWFVRTNCRVKHLAHAVPVFLTFLTGTPLSPRRINLKSLSGIVFGSPLIVGMSRREGFCGAKNSAGERG